MGNIYCGLSEALMLKICPLSLTYQVQCRKTSLVKSSEQDDTTTKARVGTSRSCLSSGREAVSEMTGGSVKDQEPTD